MTTTPTTVTDSSVIAEDAPIGVLLWPVRSSEYAPNYMLASVAIIRDEYRTYVRWTYQGGNVRDFGLGESVAVRLAS